MREGWNHPFKLLYISAASVTPDGSFEMLTLGSGPGLTESLSIVLIRHSSHLYGQWILRITNLLLKLLATHAAKDRKAADRLSGCVLNASNSLEWQDLFGWTLHWSTKKAEVDLSWDNYGNLVTWIWVLKSEVKIWRAVTLHGDWRRDFPGWDTWKEDDMTR